MAAAHDAGLVPQAAGDEVEQDGEQQVEVEVAHGAGGDGADDEDDSFDEEEDDVEDDEEEVLEPVALRRSQRNPALMYRRQ